MTKQLNLRPATRLLPAEKHMTEEAITMKAIVVTDQAAGTAGMKLVERPSRRQRSTTSSFRFMRQDSPGMN